MSDTAHRSATELMHWEGARGQSERTYLVEVPFDENGIEAHVVIEDFDPEKNPAHATMLMDFLRVDFQVNISSTPTNYCCLIEEINRDYSEFQQETANEMASVDESGDTWMQAFCNTVIALMDRKES